MTRKLITATFILALAAGIAMNGLFKSEMAVVKASTEAAKEAAAASPAFAVCDGIIRNVKVRALGKSDFEITWDFAPADPCLQAQSFNIEVRAKRNVGGVAGKELLNVAGGERRVIAKFRSIAGFDKVEATVTASITIKPFGQAFLNL